MKPINLADFVSDALDHTDFETQEVAFETIANRLSVLAPRAMTAHERAKVGTEVAVQWNHRHQPAEEALV